MGYGTIFKRNCIKCGKYFENTADTDTCISCLLRPSKSAFNLDHNKNGFSKKIKRIKKDIEAAKAEAKATDKPVIVSVQKINHIKEHDTYIVTNEVRDAPTLDIKKEKRKYTFKPKTCNKCFSSFTPTSGAQKICSICKEK